MSEPDSSLPKYAWSILFIEDLETLLHHVRWATTHRREFILRTVDMGWSMEIRTSPSEDSWEGLLKKMADEKYV